jgi:hypothetical protein
VQAQAAFRELAAVGQSQAAEATRKAMNSKGIGVSQTMIQSSAEIAHSLSNRRVSNEDTFRFVRSVQAASPEGSMLFQTPLMGFISKMPLH